MALNSLQFNLSRAIGPVIAGVLLARRDGACFAVNALSFLAVIVALWRIELPPPAAAPTESLAQSLRAGFRHVRDEPAPARAHAARGRGELPGLPADHLPAGDRGRRAAHGRAGLQPAALELRRRRDRGRLTTAQRGHAPGRGRLLLLGFVGLRRRDRGGRASRAASALSMALLFVAGLSLVTAFSTLNSLVQENAPGRAARAACSASSASPSAAACRSGAWSRALLVRGAAARRS